jgi:hypothetical protein
MIDQFTNQRGDLTMEYKLHQLKLGVARLDMRYVRLAMVLLSLTLFVLGAGAPDMGGDIGR